MVTRQLQGKLEITTQMPYVLVAAYGSLRKECYNNYILGESEHMGTYETTPEFTMYGKGCNFPFLAKGGTTAITYDLFKVKSNVILQRLNQLEGFTGYPDDPMNWYDVVSIQTPCGTAIMYVMKNPGEEITQLPIVESGDWKNK